MKPIIQFQPDRIRGFRTVDSEGPYKSVFILHLREDGKAFVEIGSRHESENGTLREVWLGVSNQWEAETRDSIVVSDFAVDRLLDKLDPLLERVYQGHQVYWDGSNHRGSLTEDARDAAQEIDDIMSVVFATQHPDTIRNEDWTVWSRSEWLGAVEDYDGADDDAFVDRIVLVDDY